MIDALFRTLADRDGMGTAKDGWRTLKLASSKLPSGRTVFMLFRDGCPSPAWVAKVQRDERFRGRTVREEEVRNHLRASLPADLRGSIPEVQVCDVDGHTALLERGVTGKCLGRTLKPKNSKAISADFRVAFTWLLKFQQATRREISAADLEARLRRPLDTLVGSWRPDALGDLPTFLERLIGATLAQGLSTQAMLAASHGDLFSKNVLVSDDGSKIWVTDWEFYAEEAFSWFDPLFFAVAYCLTDRLDPGLTPPSAFRSMFFHPGHWLSDIAKRALLEWAGALGLDPKWLTLGLALVLAEMSTRDFVTAGTHGPNDYLFLNHLKEVRQLAESSVFPL